MKQFDFALPENLIAQYPSQEREASRLMVYDRQKDQTQHQKFSDLSEILQPGDLLVLNNTKVIPARLRAHLQTGREIEVLLLRDFGKGKWSCLTKPARFLKERTSLILSDELTATVVGLGEQGMREIQFEPHDSLAVLEHAQQQGKMPLPPYIKRKAETLDKERYQTVYAQQVGAVAAPTAGLHFTEPLFETLKQKGIETAFVTLHVGLGTFRPLTEKEWEAGRLHPEEVEISEASVKKINTALKEKRRVIAVGTTSVRALESAALKNVPLKAGTFETDLFIFPPYDFKVIAGMITNFHLPNSSLLWLVSALAGEEKVRALYEEAIQKQYRFYSYGDAMLIL